MSLRWQSELVRLISVRRETKKSAPAWIPPASFRLRWSHHRRLGRQRVAPARSDQNLPCPSMRNPRALRRTPIEECFESSYPNPKLDFRCHSWLYGTKEFLP